MHLSRFVTKHFSPSMRSINFGLVVSLLLLSVSINCLGSIIGSLSGHLTSGCRDTVTNVTFRFGGPTLGFSHIYKPVFEDYAFGVNDEGASFVVNEHNDPNFTYLASYCTDGTNSFLRWSTALVGFGGVGGGGLESEVFSSASSTDARGYEIDSFELTIHQLVFSYTPVPWTDVEFDFSINIYGHIVPEPSTLIMFGSSLAAVGAYSYCRRNHTTKV
jgi:hypothetical protein